jgi:hypothetical protein
VQIQILSTSVTSKLNKSNKTYQELEVAFKNLSFNGKVEAKKLFDFGAQADTFKILATAKGADVYEVDVIKNTAGYNDWVKATKGTATNVSTGSTTPAVASSAGSTQKGGWETPEERAKKQIYIVRQSSISAAVNALSVGVKTPPKANEVIEYARELEAFVFEADRQANVASRDVGTIDTLEEDLPF